MSGAGKAEGFGGWALVEVMGHKRFAGRVSEHTVAGQGFIRVDVPEVERDGERLEPFTKLIGPGSIYGITPLSEQVARAMASTLRERPVHTWDLPKLAAPASPDAEPVDGLGDHHYPGFEGDPDDAFDEEE